MTRPAEDRPPLDSEPRSRHYGRAATLLLLAVAAIFLAISQVEHPNFWLLLARASSEAALVGGLADWFAVTALFRRPLGLPIPHTAVVIRNKDRIGQGLGAFVEQHILDPVLIIGRLREAQLARRVGLWLSRRRHAAQAADQIAAVIPFLMNGLSDRQVQDFLRRVFSGPMRNMDVAPLLGTVLRQLREGGRHQDLFDRGLAAARDYLLANELTVYRMVEDRSSWWVPSRIDRRVAQAILHGIADLLADMGEHDHDARRKFDAAVDRFIEELRTSPELAARIAAVRDQVLGSAEMQAYLASLWSDVKAAVAKDQANPDSGFRRALADILRSFGVTLARDPKARAWLDQWFETLARSALSPFRVQIGRFIADVVRGWEAQTIADRIESAVGRDLQYIRINGTIVGAIVGCALFLINRFVL